MGRYNRAHYLSFADATLVDQFYAYVNELQALSAGQGWQLKDHPRKRWCAFKLAENSKTAFGIGFDSRNTLFLYIKRVEDEAKTFSVPVSSYNQTHDQAQYILEPNVKQLKGFLPLLKLAYERSRT